MNYVWPISALYFGPSRCGRTGVSERATIRGRRKRESALAKYVHWYPALRRGLHDWRRVGEWLVFLAGLNLAGSVLLRQLSLRFAFAFVAGIVFQYFSIAPMRHLGLREGLKAAVKADTISILAFEIGMFAWMAVTSRFLFHPRLEPTDPTYWFMMQIAMMIGFATSYPANRLLIRHGWKEAM